MRDPLLIFFFSSVAGRTRKLSEAGRWVRGVRGMDAAAASPRTGLRRPREPTPPGQAQLCFRRPSSQPRGAAPLAENSVPLDARHSAPSICACADTAFSFSPRARRDCSIVAQCRRQRPSSNPDPPPCARTSPPVPTAPAAVPVRHAPAAPPGRWPRFPAHGQAAGGTGQVVRLPLRLRGHPQVFHLRITQRLHRQLLVVRTCGRIDCRQALCRRSGIDWLDHRRRAGHTGGQGQAEAGQGQGLQQDRMFIGFIGSGGVAAAGAAAGSAGAPGLRSRPNQLRQPPPSPFSFARLARRHCRRARRIRRCIAHHEREAACAGPSSVVFRPVAATDCQSRPLLLTRNGALGRRWKMLTRPHRAGSAIQAGLLVLVVADPDHRQMIAGVAGIPAVTAIVGGAGLAGRLQAAEAIGIEPLRVPLETTCCRPTLIRLAAIESPSCAGAGVLS